MKCQDNSKEYDNFFKLKFLFYFYHELSKKVMNMKITEYYEGKEASYPLVKVFVIFKSSYLNNPPNCPIFIAANPFLVSESHKKQ